MSRNELLDAYQYGRISRRTFVKGMSALGFSVMVANVLADRVRAAGVRHQVVRGDDAYDDVYDDVYGEGGHHHHHDHGTSGGAGGTTTLPNTGSGAETSNSWVAPAAVVGAGAVAAAAYLRKKTGEAPVE